MSAMQKLTPWMDKIQSSFMEKLDNFAGKGNPFDFPKFLHFFSFDVSRTLSSQKVSADPNIV